MGVLVPWHRRGVGRLLLAHAEEWLKKRGFEYLSVKTLAEGTPETDYVATRAFYEAMDFRPLEILKTYWNEENPCQVYIKALK